MPLNVLIILVVGGISLIAMLLHGLGKSRLTVLSSEGARTAWNRHFPDDEVIDVTVAQDGHAALVQTSEGPGLLWSFGADTVARHLRNFDLLEKAGSLRIKFHDFTAPRVTLHLNEIERPVWQKMMSPA